ncbi:MAG: MBL fold metallo-hydrolase [[Clostridium] leptum]
MTRANGTRDRRSRLSKSAGVEKLDLVIATHPHSDHIGGMPDVLSPVRGGRDLMPQMAEDPPHRYSTACWMRWKRRVSRSRRRSPAWHTIWAAAQS